MPRNGSGTYSLPAGNPVVAGDVIEASWANTTLSDVANELTNSLSRNGNGGMLAPFRVADGSVSAPGLGFTNETNTGLYRAGSGEIWLTVGGIAVAQVTVNGMLIPAGKRITLPAPVNTTDATNKEYVDDLVAPVIGYADLYLGSKSSDPTLNNSGGALVQGVTYWSSTLQQMRVYNGTNWVPMPTISSLVGQTFNGTGAQTAFTLANPTGNAINLEVFISGVRQVPTTDYSVSGTTLTFVAAPPSGSSNIFVRYAQLGTITDGAGSIVYTPAGTGAVATTVQTKLRESVSVKDFGAVGDGVTDDTAAIQNAINELNIAGGGVLLFPAGDYFHATQLVFKNNIEYVGDGYGSTQLTYTGTSDQVVIQNPINSSTLAAIRVNGIKFTGASIASLHGNLFDTGSSEVVVENCFFNPGNGIGLILDQSELWEIRNNYFAGVSAEGGIWFINGTDRNPSSNTYYTNRISVNNCQFNVGGIGVIDDGGIAHSFIDNNYNAGTSYFRICAVYCPSIQGGEFENCSSTGILFRQTTWQGTLRWATENAVVNGGSFASGAVATIMDVGSNALKNLQFSNCQMNTPAGTLITNINNCSSVFASNNAQVGPGSGGIYINNYYSRVPVTPLWTGSVSNPSIGNGTLVGYISRTGKTVRYTVNLTVGSTTNLGSGNWQFTFPVAPDTSFIDIGSAFMVGGGVFYVGVARGNVYGNVINVFAAASTANAVGAAVPVSWAAGDFLEFSIEFSAASWLN